MARKRRRRGYSTAFTPHGTTGKHYLLADIPAGLWAAVREKAKREGMSLRAAILTLLTKWIQPDPQPAEKATDDGNEQDNVA